MMRNATTWLLTVLMAGGMAASAQAAGQAPAQAPSGSQAARISGSITELDLNAPGRSLKLAGKDGQVWTLTLDPDTTAVMQNGRHGELNQLKVGQSVEVRAMPKDGKHIAQSIEIKGQQAAASQPAGQPQQRADAQPAQSGMRQDLAKAQEQAEQRLGEARQEAQQDLANAQQKARERVTDAQRAASENLSEAEQRAQRQLTQAQAAPAQAQAPASQMFGTVQGQIAEADTNPLGKRYVKISQPSGQTQQLDLDDNTVVTQGGQPADFNRLQVGQSIQARFLNKDGKQIAQSIEIRSPGASTPGAQRHPAGHPAQQQDRP